MHNQFQCSTQQNLKSNKCLHNKIYNMYGKYNRLMLGIWHQFDKLPPSLWDFYVLFILVK